MVKPQTSTRVKKQQTSRVKKQQTSPVKKQQTSPVKKQQTSPSNLIKKYLIYQSCQEVQKDLKMRSKTRIL